MMITNFAQSLLWWLLFPVHVHQTHMQIKKYGMGLLISLFIVTNLIFFQVFSIMQMRYVLTRLHCKLNRYPEISGMDILSEESTCAICWEHLETGRRLPCTHLFHASCLLAWLHQDLSCPTCRHKLHKPEQVSWYGYIQYCFRFLRTLK